MLPGICTKNSVYRAKEQHFPNSSSGIFKPFKVITNSCSHLWLGIQVLLFAGLILCLNDLIVSLCIWVQTRLTWKVSSRIAVTFKLSLKWYLEFINMWLWKLPLPIHQIQGWHSLCQHWHSLCPNTDLLGSSHWKDWHWWNSNTLAPWCEELTHSEKDPDAWRDWR